jgi:hypothetical protein
MVKNTIWGDVNSGSNSIQANLVSLHSAPGLIDQRLRVKRKMCGEATMVLGDLKMRPIMG